MQMGDRPGTTLTQGYGRVIDDVSTLPPVFASLNRDHSRSVLDDLDNYLAL